MNCTPWRPAWDTKKVGLVISGRAAETALTTRGRPVSELAMLIIGIAIGVSIGRILYRDIPTVPNVTVVTEMNVSEFWRKAEDWRARQR